MHARLILVTLLGVGLAAYLIFNVGFATVLAAIVTVGWEGFASLLSLALALFIVLGAAWHVLVQRTSRQGILTFIWGRLVRDSAAEVLPFSQVGGFLIGARAVMLRGVPAPVAFGSTIVDVTTELIAQLAYVVLGIALLVSRTPHVPASLTSALMLGMAAAAIAGGLFVLVQKQGLKLTERLAAGWLPGGMAHAKAVAAAVDAIYRQPACIGLSFVLHLAAWIASAGLTWQAFHLMGAPIDLGAVIAIDSLVFAARSAAFFMPNALGVQEAAFAVLAPMFGIGPELGIAASLLKRGRDIVIGVPILIAWQALEGSRVLQGRGEPNLLKAE